MFTDRAACLARLHEQRTQMGSGRHFFVMQVGLEGCHMFLQCVFSFRRGEECFSGHVCCGVRHERGGEGLA